MKTVAAILLLFSSVSAEFPSFINICKRDSRLNNCIKKNILSVKDQLEHGIPSLFVPKYNPFVFKEDSVSQSDTLKITVGKDFVVTGMSDFNIKTVNFDIDKNSFELEWFFKKTFAYGYYRLEGNIDKYKINSSGECRLNSTNYGVNLKMQGERREKDGKTFIDFNKSEVNFPRTNFQILRIHFDNLLPSVEETETYNKYFNENIETTALKMKPAAEKLFLQLVGDTIRKLFNTYSIDELFPL